MWTSNKILHEDLEMISCHKAIEWNQFKNKSFFITGGTGLIGYTLVSALVYASIKYNLNISLYLLVRDEDKAKSVFSSITSEFEGLNFIAGDVETASLKDFHADYIVHGASPTSSAFFVEHPVETIKTAINGTQKILDYARCTEASSVVYLSSMEVYGSPKTENLLSETDIGYMDPMFVRNCYPEGKRLCEAMCAAYASEYGIRAISLRLAQTFGPGVKVDDGRVFADFARKVRDNEDIVLLTSGTSKRCYLYTMDCVSAILTVLLRGEGGRAYNVGNSSSYCSIVEMAHMVADEVAGGKISVVQELDAEKAKKFSPPHFYNLDMTSIKKLGWYTTRDLPEMYKILVKEFEA